jgi:2',3'-cyclic-nucleotide 2'-phosphodiesterase/3'-nucleotidase/5'-nucleotidase
MPWSIRLIHAALALPLLTACASTELPELEPVSHESGANAIRLQVIGRYTTGFYDIGAAAPTAYDPLTRRLFVLSVDRGWIDILDISDPSRPERIMRANVLSYGGFPNSVAVKNGILAVAIKAFLDELPGQVLFLDLEGRPLVDPVKVGAKPVELAFTPDGGTVVTANQGEASADYSFDPQGSISIIDLGLAGPGCRGADCAIAPRATTLDFRGYNDRKAELIAAGVRIFGPNASVAQDLEPEALAIAPDGQTAWVSLQRNNAMAIVDLPARSLREVVALGSKDHSRPENALDASNVDGEINIRPWPIRSFYEPDIFAAYDVGGETFLVTPNEGDPRDFEGFSEVVRVRALRLDPEAFPDAASLQEDRNLGRLRVTNVEGDGDGDGDFDQIFVLGARSFAIWDARARLVFDSGDDLEQIIAEALPECFNCADSNIRFDSQSDDRGPEPETLTVGEVGSRPYAFIAPERIGGVYVYDVGDPQEPVFQQYINFRNFAIDPDQVCEEARPKSEECERAGDLGPEGVLFIPRADSPIDAALVVVSNELSSSATLYRVDEVR